MPVYALPVASFYCVLGRPHDLKSQIISSLLPRESLLTSGLLFVQRGVLQMRMCVPVYMRPEGSLSCHPFRLLPPCFVGQGLSLGLGVTK